MATLNRDTVLSATDLEVRILDVPEWGGQIRLKTMDGTRRDMFDAELQKRRISDNEVDIREMKALLLVLTAVDDSDQMIFELRDVKELNKKSGAVLDRLWDDIRQMNGIGQSNLEEMTKNSAAVQSGSSGSD